MRDRGGVSARLSNLDAASTLAGFPVDVLTPQLRWAVHETSKGVFSPSVETQMATLFDGLHDTGADCILTVAAGISAPIGKPATTQPSWLVGRGVERLLIKDASSVDVYVPDVITPASKTQYLADLGDWFTRIATLLAANDKGGHPRYTHCLAVGIPGVQTTDTALGYGPGGVNTAAWNTLGSQSARRTAVESYLLDAGAALAAVLDPGVGILLTAGALFGDGLAAVTNLLSSLGLGTRLWAEATGLVDGYAASHAAEHAWLLAAKARGLPIVVRTDPGLPELPTAGAVQRFIVAHEDALADYGMTVAETQRARLDNFATEATASYRGWGGRVVSVPDYLVSAAPVPGEVTDGIFMDWAPEFMSFGVGTEAYTDALAVEQAKTFDIICPTPGGFAARAATIKATDPSTLIFVYVNGAYVDDTQGPLTGDFPTGQYARNIANHYCRSVAFNNWLMKVKDSGWRADRLAKVLAILGSSPNYDGPFFDLLGSAPLSTSYNYGALADGSRVAGENGWPVDPDTSLNYTEANYRDDVIGLLGVVQAGIGSKIVTGNGLQQGSEYASGASDLFDSADYIMAEIFVRGPEQGVSTHRPEASWIAEVDMLVDAAAGEHHVLCMTKVWVSATQAQIDAWHRYALATYYMGASRTPTGKRSAAFAFRQDHQRMHAHRYHHHRLGDPAEDYTQLGNGAYRRLYTGGVVYANPSSATLTPVSLGGTLYDLEGNTKTSVTLGPWEGTVLATTPPA